MALHLAGIFGVNQGYVSDGHDGANHVALHMNAEYALTDSWMLTVHAAHSWALEQDRDKPDDALLNDFFHGEFGVQKSF